MTSEWSLPALINVVPVSILLVLTNSSADPQRNVLLASRQLRRQQIEKEKQWCLRFWNRMGSKIEI